MPARHTWQMTSVAVVLATCMVNESARPESDERPTAKETTDEQVAPEVPKLTAIVRVTNGEGQPVAGAAVKPLGLRTRKEPGSHYGWRDDLWGPVPDVKTGADGIAEVQVPRHVYEEMETGQVTWWVDHPRHVVFWEDRPVNDRPAEVVLQDGVLIAARAIDDTTGRPIDAPFAVVSGTGFGEEWTLQGDGSLVSRAVSQQRRSLRVMHLPQDPDEPALFSELIDLQKQGGLVLDLTVRVKPGVRVRGRIDDGVPRPMTNGRVTAMVISRPESAADDQTYESLWQWQETALVEPDGTFDLGWLPEGEPLQFLAVSDGFVSRNLTPQEVDAFGAEHRQLVGGVQRMQDNRTWPRLAALQGTETMLSLPMDPTVSCRVIVIGPDNELVEGATVHFWPNQAWFQGGSQSLGFGVSMSGLLRAARAEPSATDAKNRAEMRDQFRRFQATSDENGVALVTNLPALGEDSFSVNHPALELPTVRDPDLFRRWRTVNLTPGKVAEVTVKLQPKGTEVIGRTE